MNFKNKGQASLKFDMKYYINEREDKENLEIVR